MSAIDPPPFLAELRQELARVAEADAAGAGAPQQTSRRGLRLPQVRMPRMQLALPVLAALATIVIATVVVIGGIPGAHDGTAATQQSGRPPQELYAPSLLEHLDLLQRVHAEDDAIVRRGYDGLVEDGLLPGESLRIAPPIVNDASATTLALPIWAVPDQHGDVALVAFRPEEGGPVVPLIVDAARIADNRAFATIANDLVGLAPNGVESVTVTIRGGGRVVLPVVDNFFGAHLTAKLESVEWGGMKRP